jgi:hypothetical protein
MARADDGLAFASQPHARRRAKAQRAHPISQSGLAVDYDRRMQSFVPHR